MGSSKSNTKMYAIVLAALVLGGLYFTGNLKVPKADIATGSVTPATTFTSTTSSSSSTALAKDNPVTIQLTHKDAGSQAALTEATNVKTVALVPNGLGGYAAGPATSSSAISYFMPDNTGYAYLDFETQASGQAYAFNPTKTAAVNAGRDIQCTYMDWDLDGTQEYVCKVSTSGLSGQYALTQSATLPLTVMWDNIAWFTLSSPSDVSSIGTTAGTSKYTSYTWTGTAGDTAYLSKISLLINSTSTNKWSESDMYIKMKDAPGLQWNLSPGTYTDSQGQQYTVTRGPSGTSSTLYEILYGYKLGSAKKIDMPINGSGTIAVEIKNVFNLATSDVLAETLKINGVSEVDGSQTERTDLVNYSA